MEREVFDADHRQFREAVREFIAREITPHHERWEKAGICDRSVYTEAAKQGVIGFNVPEEFGGGGVHDFRFNAVVAEELAAARAHGPGFNLHNNIVAPYLLNLANDEQKARWLPGFASGEEVWAIAMTEPGTGSDLKGIATTAVRDGDEWVVNGAKTFISNGIHSDRVIVVARTDPGGGSRAFSLLVVERDMPGFTRGRNLDKLGLHAQDTAELFFENVRVPVANLLGKEGHGFYHLMANLPEERMSIAVSAVAASRSILDETVEYTKTRTAFGQPIGSFQNSRFTLAELDTEVDIAQVYIDRCLVALVAGKLSHVEAAKAKWWTTELQQKVVDRCLQLHGGYGFMMEYPVAKAYADARIQTIFGGTTEIMKEIVGRALGV
ncbi:Acyl-CoA dehydrogenase [Thermomonospora echinospora]|uniref:Acyl-[acyl-carrier-protein] dehydrogenase MbtN n=1 Tax=Thermomonospora echinospora TaxID=1992 RepID=A0A1H6DTP1_9ACTN|nr:acyl-CoA dehydrogenase family protein [Thermomonospora echinospora]SEG88651.1 Acyl-CoA dehydrogenase [Thermomonospora echinospora]